MRDATDVSEVGAEALRLPTFRRWVGLLTLSGLLLRCTRLGAQSIWVDEGMTIAWIDAIESLGWRSLLDNIHGPLHAAVLYAVSRISMDEWWLRLPSALAGTLAIPAVAQLGRRLWGDRCGVTAAALLAVSPFALYYAQEVRNYAFTILFASLALTAAWDLVARPSWRSGVGLAVFELLAILSNLNGVFLALGLNAWVLFALPRQRQAWRVWLIPQVLVALSLVPYAWSAAQQVRPERMVGVESDVGQNAPLRGATTLHPMSLPYTAYAFAAGYSLGLTLEELRAEPAAAARKRHWPAVAAVLLGFGVPLVVGLLGAGARPGVFLVASVAVVVVGFTVWLAATNVKPFNVRYLSVLLPVYLVLVGRGVWLLPRAPRTAVAALVLIVSLWSCANYLFVPRYGRDDARGALQFVRTQASPGDLVLHINLGFPVLYYGNRWGDLPERIQHAEPPSGTSLDAAREYVGRIVETHARLWFLESRAENLDPNGYLRRACEERASTSETRQFIGIRVHRFEFEKSSHDSRS